MSLETCFKESTLTQKRILTFDIFDL